MRKWRSIIQKEPTECFLCGCRVGLQKHHCLHGFNRTCAEKSGCYVMLCVNCHGLLHDKGDGDKDLQRIAQRIWMVRNGKTEDDCRRYWGKLVT